uniref:ATP synthase subunit a n=1 Tax=Bahadzia jaraguensis TaxID=1041811 RepID=K7ZU01_BAHJA|nr:ATP synthase F0 subunit 6 [Bahadzia jaraguensis]
MMTNLFSIFDPTTYSFLSLNWFSLIIFILFTPLSYWLIPNRMKLLFSIMTNYLFKEFKPLNQKAPFLFIFIISLFLFILMNNLPGLLPYVFTASSHMSFTMTLAITMWFTLMMYGWRNNYYNLLIHLIPQGTPLPLTSFMVIIETISNLIRPATLAIRLSANMIAGHLLITLLCSANSITPFMFILPLYIFQIVLACLEIAVAFIQAYVFSVLMTLYSTELTN